MHLRESMTKRAVLACAPHPVQSDDKKWVHAMTTRPRQNPDRLEPAAILFLVTILLTVFSAGLATFLWLTGTPIWGVLLTLAGWSAMAAWPVSHFCQMATVRAAASAAHREPEHGPRNELIKTIQRLARVGYWDLHPETGQFELSDVIHEMLGDPDRALCMNLPKLLEMTNPADRDQLQAAMARMIENGTMEQVEFRIAGLDGVERLFWSIGVSQAGSDRQGSTTLYGAWKDVTELRAADVARFESQDHYRHAVELSPQIPWTEDLNGESIELDAGWLALTGMTQDEAQKGGWLKALHPDDLQHADQVWQRCLSSGEPYDDEYRLRVADGTYRWFRSRATARRDTDGKIIRWYGTVEDIHDRRGVDAALRESEAFVRSILDSSSNCVEVLDLEGRLQFMNRSGLTKLEINDLSPYYGQDWGMTWPEASHPELRRAIAAARAGETVTFTAYGPTMKGTPKWWEVCMSSIPDADGRPMRLLSISRDITADKMVQDELERARQRADDAAKRLGAVLESTTDSVVIIDKDWRISFLNPRAAEMISAGRQLVGMSIWHALPGDSGNTFEQQIRGAVARQEAVQFEEFEAPLGIWLEVHAFPSSEGLSIFFRDISRRRAAQEQLLYVSLHDSLTGLSNRTMLQEQLEMALAQTDNEAKTALMILDLDEFKQVNDSWGHPAGDRLLAEAADRLRACVRDTDQIARLGGDEFAIIQTGLKRAEDVIGLANRIIATLCEPFHLDGRLVTVGVSIGIAVAADPGTKAVNIMKDADAALYNAKEEGRGHLPVLRKRHAVPSARSAGTEGGSAQGLVDRTSSSSSTSRLLTLKTGKVSGFEALLRWHQPVRGVLMPDDFIPLAEEIGAISDIGAWVIDHACREAARWPGDVSVSINLSPAQFLSEGLVAAVSRGLRNSGLAARRLQLEITETVLLKDTEGTIAILHALRDLGVRISMDDFGTGHSTLSYLRQFPFDTIKIDQTFVADMPDNIQTAAIVRSVIELAQGLGISTTAEGIETEAQRAGALRPWAATRGRATSSAAPSLQMMFWRSSIVWMASRARRHDPALEFRSAGPGLSPRAPEESLTAGRESGSPGMSLAQDKGSGRNQWCGRWVRRQQCWAGAWFLETAPSAAFPRNGGRAWTTRTNRNLSHRRPRPRRRAPHTLAALGPRPVRAGASRQRGKLDAVQRLMRGESLEALSRELNVPAHRLSEWRDRVLLAAESAQTVGRRVALPLARCHLHQGP